MRIKNECDRAMRQFIEMMKKHKWSANTVRAYERGVMFFLRWLVSDTKIESLAEVTSETIEAWREELGRWKISDSTRELRFAAVKTFFRLMNEAGAVDMNEALQALGVLLQPYTRADLAGQPIADVDFNEVQDRAK